MVEEAEVGTSGSHLATFETASSNSGRGGIARNCKTHARARNGRDGQLLPPPRF